MGTYSAVAQAPASAAGAHATLGRTARLIVVVAMVLGLAAAGFAAAQLFAGGATDTRTTFLSPVSTGSAPSDMPATPSVSTP